LDDTYTKTKHSLDENTTFLIGILKILNWYNSSKNIQSNKDNNANKEINIAPHNQVEKQLNSEITTATKIHDNWVSHDDINDIFWEITESNNEKKAISEQKNSLNNIIFDTKTFIDKMKENGAKWWLTMAIRWANISMDWINFIIWVHNKIHKWQVENVDNMALIIKSLNDMWIENPNIKIN
jgi:hypothetical protein